ncbi:MAG: hypothetical protein AAF438_18450 [Pseudomonadota bacterium]
MSQLQTAYSKLANYLFTPVDQIDTGWLKQWLAPFKGVAHQVELSQLARRWIQKAHEHESLRAPIDTPDLKPDELWLISDIEIQKELARFLGETSCASHVRRVIDRSGIDRLRDQLGLDTHRDILFGPNLEVKGICTDVFMAHLDSDLCDFLTSVGIGLLESTLSPENTFGHMRMRYAFSPKAWEKRFSGLSCDKTELNTLILDFVTKKTHGV